LNFESKCRFAKSGVVVELAEIDAFLPVDQQEQEVFGIFFFVIIFLRKIQPVLGIWGGF